MYETILAIETSCDETAVALLRDGVHILKSTVASSSSLHAKYGGIVPEIAAREQLSYIIPTLKETLSYFNDFDDSKVLSCIQSHIDAIAVTQGPGLIGSLLVGVETAKTLSYLSGKPLIPVNHVIAHMYANLIKTPTKTNANIVYPAISLVVSGGHTELYCMNNEKELHWLGGTIDDAAGEAFDKTARLLGFENRGGPAIQQAAQSYTPGKHPYSLTLPRPMLDPQNVYNFSFSGLKTAIAREVEKFRSSHTLHKDVIHHLAYETQEAITDVLVKKTLDAADALFSQSILISGGVSANLRLREKLAQQIQKRHAVYTLHTPDIPLCTDNASYIGCCAYFQKNTVSWRKLSANPELPAETNA